MDEALGLRGMTEPDVVHFFDRKLAEYGWKKERIPSGTGFVRVGSDDQMANYFNTALAAELEGITHSRLLYTNKLTPCNLPMLGHTFNLGRMSRRNGDYNLAIRKLEQSISLDPNLTFCLC